MSYSSCMRIGQRTWIPHPYRVLVSIFFAAFAISCVLQFLLWQEIGVIIDHDVWANQARYILEGDAQQFDYMQGYGQPAGPLIEGTVLIHSLFGTSFEHATSIALILLISAAVSAVAVCAHVLRPDILWSVALVGMLAPHWLYEHITPPIALASVLFVLVTLMSVRVYLKESIAAYIGWGLTLGALAATRADIGAFAGLMFGSFLYIRCGWRPSLIALTSAIAAFFVLNPYMWFMPIEHIGDLVFKFTYHYAVSPQTPLRLSELLTMSATAILTILLGTCMLLLQKLPRALSRAIFGIMLAGTLIATAVIMTSHFQNIRYFTPLIFMWGSFLPLILLSLVQEMQFSFAQNERTTRRIRFIAAITLVALLSFASTFWLAYSALSFFTH